MKRLSAAVLSFLLLAPVAARAQLTAPREAAQISYGPVSLYPSLQIVDAGKDSNVFDDAQDPKEDYTFTVASRALVVTRLGLNELMFSSGSDYIWFREFKSERSSNATYALRFNLSASRFKPFIGAERNRVRSRPNNEIDARVQRLDRRVLAGSNFNLTERSAITVSASADDSPYDQGQTFKGVDLAKVLSRTGRSYSGGLRYALTPLTSMTLAGTYAEDVFPHSHLRDDKRYSFAPAFEFSPDASIRGGAAIGITKFKPVDPTVAEFTGLTMNVGVNWTIFGKTAFDLKAGRDVSYSYRDTEPYYLSTNGRLSVTQHLGPLDLVGAVGDELLSYRFHSGVAPGLGSGGASTPSDATAIVASGGAGVPLGRGFRITVTAERTRRTSKIDSSENYTRTRLLSTITIGS